MPPEAAQDFDRTRFFTRTDIPAEAETCFARNRYKIRFDWLNQYRRLSFCLSMIFSETGFPFSGSCCSSDNSCETA